MQYEPEDDSDEDDSEEEDPPGEPDDEEYEADSSSGKRRSLGEGPRNSGKRRRMDGDVSLWLTIFRRVFVLCTVLRSGRIGYPAMSEKTTWHA